jgi:hypothetical protein
VDPASRITSIGADMLGWSDLARDVASPAVGLVAAAVASAITPRRVLLAGARAAALLPALDDALGSATVDVVVRGTPDAAELAARWPSIAVSCGAFDRLPAGDYDLVIGLGGPRVLYSPDSRAVGEAGTVARLASFVADAGVLVLDAENAASLTGLLAVDPVPRDDSEWWRGADGFDDRTPTLPELEAALAASGLTTTMTYAAVDDAGSPGLLVGRAEAKPGSVLFATARRRAAVVSEDAARHRALTADARDASRRAWDAGLGADLAAGWVAVAGRGARELALPAMVDAEPGLEPEQRRVVSWSGDGSASVMADRPAGRGSRPPRPLVGTPLDEAFEAACAAGTRERVRGLVVAWADWVRALPAVERPATAVRNVQLTGDGLSAIDPTAATGDGAASETADAVIARGLYDLVDDLVRRGRAHPFGSARATRDVVAELLPMGGIEGTVDELVAVAPGSDRAAALLAPDTSSLADALARLAETGSELEVARRKVTWLEGTIRARDREIGVLRRTVAVESSAAYRTLRQLARPIPALRRRAGALVRRARGGRS